MTATAGDVGILAFGSLMSDPGKEIEPLIVLRIPTTTPFPVEFARLSKSRGGAPTVVPHASGRPVKAELLVLSDAVSLDQGKSLLWRRETRRETSKEDYREGANSDAVLVREESGFQGVAHVLYTDFNASGKLSAPDPGELARKAVQSVTTAPPGKDGITYLIDLIKLGVETALTARYQQAILEQTHSSSLSEALDSVRMR